VVAGKRPRAHGPENCSCFPEVRRSAIDALIGLPPLTHKSTIESAVHPRPVRILLFVPYIFLGVSVRQLAFPITTTSDETSLADLLDLPSNRSLFEIV
jgi:hypothetical protein